MIWLIYFAYSTSHKFWKIGEGSFKKNSKIEKAAFFRKVRHMVPNGKLIFWLPLESKEVAKVYERQVHSVLDQLRFGDQELFGHSPEIDSLIKKLRICKFEKISEQTTKDNVFSEIITGSNREVPLILSAISKECLPGYYINYALRYIRGPSGAIINRDCLGRYQLNLKNSVQQKLTIRPENLW